LKLNKVVVPSVPNITELNLSNSQMRTEDITKVLTDKMLADQCRLMTAIMAKSWGRPSSKPMDTSKVAKTPSTKHVMTGMMIMKRTSGDCGEQFQDVDSLDTYQTQPYCGYHRTKAK
jgi:hypothetical protein